MRKLLIRLFVALIAVSSVASVAAADGGDKGGHEHDGGGNRP